MPTPRATPLTHPDALTIYVASVDGLPYDLRLRMPAIRHRMAVGTMLQRDRDAIEAGDAPKSERAAQLWSSLYSGWAALVGLGWAHEEYELNTKPGADLRAFGFAVLDELAEAGFPEPVVLEAGKRLMEAGAGQDAEWAEAAKAADFFGPTKRGSTAP